MRGSYVIFFNRIVYFFISDFKKKKDNWLINIEI